MQTSVSVKTGRREFVTERKENREKKVATQATERERERDAETKRGRERVDDVALETQNIYKYCKHYRQRKANKSRNI